MTKLEDGCSLHNCNCEHGDVWHEDRKGKCSFQRCNCEQLEISWAIRNGKRLSPIEHGGLS